MSTAEAEPGIPYRGRTVSTTSRRGTLMEQRTLGRTGRSVSVALAGPGAEATGFDDSRSDVDLLEEFAENVTSQFDAYSA